jgi:hypothetical protein
MAKQQKLNMSEVKSQKCSLIINMSRREGELTKINRPDFFSDSIRKQCQSQTITMAQ